MSLGRSFARASVVLALLFSCSLPGASVAAPPQPLSVSCFTNPSDPTQIKIAITNLSSTSTTAIRLAIVRNTTLLGTVSTTVSVPAGVAHWFYTDTSPSEQNGDFSCVATHVEFSDGTSWNGPDPSAAPTAAQVAATPNPYAAAEASLANDAAFSDCEVHHVPADGDRTSDDLSTEFRCVYGRKDYHAAEVLGEALASSGVRLDQQQLYHLAYAFYKRGNSEKAMAYARQAYSRVTASNKAQCRSNINSCSDLRRLLVALRPSYRSRFASEDASIQAARREAAAQAAEAAREAAAIAFSDSGSGIHSTEVFHVSGSWELDWSYDCSNFSDSGGNFIVDVDGDVEDVLVNQLGSIDSGTEYVHQGGNVFLKINSECSWTVKAVND